MFVRRHGGVLAFVVGAVEAAALEDDAGARADEATQMTAALLAGRQAFSSDVLEKLEAVSAVFAFVFVRGHEVLQAPASLQLAFSSKVMLVKAE